MTFGKRSSGDSTNVRPLFPESPARVRDDRRDQLEEHRQFVQLREEGGWTQLELTSVIGKSRATVERYQAGTSPIPGRVLIRMRRLINERKAKRAA